MPKIKRSCCDSSFDREKQGELTDVLRENSDPQKPDISYIEMIARAILESPTKKLRLQEIYDSIERGYPYFRNADPGWRNSVRHNLSLHECFCKGERCENGKGHYWVIHPANLPDFQRGDFRRRLIRSRARRLQQCQYLQYHPYAPELHCGTYTPLHYGFPATYGSFLPYGTPYGTYYPLPSATDALKSSWFNDYPQAPMQAKNLQTVHESYSTIQANFTESDSVATKPTMSFSVKNILSTQMV